MSISLIRVVLQHQIEVAPLLQSHRTSRTRKRIESSDVDPFDICKYDRNLNSYLLICELRSINLLLLYIGDLIERAFRQVSNRKISRARRGSQLGDDRFRTLRMSAMPRIIRSCIRSFVPDTALNINRSKTHVTHIVYARYAESAGKCS